MRKRQNTEAGPGRPPGPVPPTRSAGRAYRASCGSGPGRPMASHGLSALRQETPARKTASASFPPPAPDSSRGTRTRDAPGTLLPPPLWTPWPVTVRAGERPGGGDGPSPCRPTPLCKEEPAASRARQSRAAWGRGRDEPRPVVACGGQGWSLPRPRPPLTPPPAARWKVEYGQAPPPEGALFTPKEGGGERISKGRESSPSRPSRAGQSPRASVGRGP